MKYVSMLLFMVAMSFCMTSCGDDDSPANNEVGNFYIEYNVTGGGLTAAQLNSVKNQLSNEFGSYLYGMETQEAIYTFKELVKLIRNSTSKGVEINGAAISGTMDITLILKTEEGKQIKKGVIHVTKDGSSYEV